MVGGDAPYNYQLEEGPTLTGTAPTTGQLSTVNYQLSTVQCQKIRVFQEP
jgi:hypothetical protein